MCVGASSARAGNPFARRSNSDRIAPKARECRGSIPIREAPLSSRLEAHAGKATRWQDPTTTTRRDGENWPRRRRKKRKGSESWKRRTARSRTAPSRLRAPRTPSERDDHLADAGGVLRARSLAEGLSPTPTLARARRARRLWREVHKFPHHRPNVRPPPGHGHALGEAVAPPRSGRRAEPRPQGSGTRYTRFRVPGSEFR